LIIIGNSAFIASINQFAGRATEMCISAKSKPAKVQTRQPTCNVQTFYS